MAVDIDVKSIKYASHHYTSPRIVHQVDDISLPWDELSPKIRQLENRVDLIFSNRVLHWIENKQQAIENFYRLLKQNNNSGQNSNGGTLYANITTLLDLFYDLTLEEKVHYDQLLNIPTEEQQVEQFRSLFIRNHFLVIDIESSVLRQIYPGEEFKSGIIIFYLLEDVLIFIVFFHFYSNFAIFPKFN